MPTYEAYESLPYGCYIIYAYDHFFPKSMKNPGVTGPLGRQGDDPSLRPRPRTVHQRPRRPQRHGAEPAAGGGAQRGGGGDSHGAWIQKMGIQYHGDRMG